jgi:hypothetical protein
VLHRLDQLETICIVIMHGSEHSQVSTASLQTSRARLPFDAACSWTGMHGFMLGTSSSVLVQGEQHRSRVGCDLGFADHAV